MHWFWCQYRSVHSRDQRSVKLDSCTPSPFLLSFFVKSIQVLSFFCMVCIVWIVQEKGYFCDIMLWLMCKNNALLPEREENEKFRWNNLRHSCPRSSILPLLLSKSSFKYQKSEKLFFFAFFSNVAKWVNIADSPSDCVCNICDRGFKKDNADPKRFHPKQNTINIVPLKLYFLNC